MKNSPLLLLGLISTLSVVQLCPIIAIAQSLPDDIDVQKYSNILSQSLQILNSKKSVLTNYQDDAARVQSQINSKSSLIAAREQNIAQLMKTIDEKNILFKCKFKT